MQKSKQGKIIDDGIQIQCLPEQHIVHITFLMKGLLVASGLPCLQQAGVLARSYGLCRNESPAFQQFFIVHFVIVYCAS